MAALVTYQLEDSVATITMDDGKLNVVSPALLNELNTALDRAVQDRAVVVLTGRPGAFSAGFDLSVLKPGGAAAAALLHGGFDLAKRLLSFPQPVVIACSGHAIAMGVFLLLSADYRLGTIGQFKITANEVAIGMTLPRAAVEICLARLAPTHCHRAVALAEIFSPESAVSAGFLDEVVPAAELRSAAQTLAKRLTKLHPAAHENTKLRARARLLENLAAAIRLDDQEFRAAIA